MGSFRQGAVKSGSWAAVLVPPDRPPDQEQAAAEGCTTAAVKDPIRLARLQYDRVQRTEKCGGLVFWGLQSGSEEVTDLLPAAHQSAPEKRSITHRFQRSSKRCHVWTSPYVVITSIKSIQYITFLLLFCTPLFKYSSTFKWGQTCLAREWQQNDLVQTNTSRGGLAGRVTLYCLKDFNNVTKG